MTPVDLIDLIDAIKTYGILAVCVGLPTVILICGLAYSRVKSWVDDKFEVFKALKGHADEFSTLVEEVRGALTRFDSGFSQHVEDTERLSHEDHWKSCQVDKCPYLHKFFAQLEDTEQMIVKLSDEAKASQAQTRADINTIMRRFDDFASAALNLARRNCAK